ncbi:hydroxymethylbilane synthase [Pelagibacterium xiamenense]|uniref:hydroxymethylbilane synthase n=1 Tax=Pelagibacterium xiamenense TaxID=2901140 RepID=UPI001E5509BD|nr:hydroxymethylbilane synthase [Pelagibacterium xiamenense]MCD7058313.1 hydroxymethylbilane synthase [Pelagibacterium xiamenense]
MQSITIGTRGSPLAVAQAEEVRNKLAAAHGLGLDTIAIKVIRTSGDMIQDRPLSEVGGKGLFTKEIEKALYDGEIDLAVHSAKDMPTHLPEGMVLSAFLEREDVRDAFISLIARSPDHLPEGAKIGTSSLRRGAQFKRLRPDFRTVDFRGNVATRLKKLADGVADATLLALAGLNRLGEAHRATLILDTRDFPPAPAQGAICIETRANDTRVTELVAALDHAETATRVSAERAFLDTLDGSCKTPIAAFSTLEGARLTLFGQILSPDGKEAFEDEVVGDATEARALGHALGEKLKAEAGADFLDTLKRT